MQHRQLEIRRLAQNVRGAQSMRRRVDQLAVGNERCRLREPGRIPERSDFAASLVTRAGAAVEAVIGRSLKEKRSHGMASSLRVLEERAVRLQAITLAAP